MNRSNERELVACGKSVFISDSDHISREFNFILKHYSRKQIKFKKGNLLQPEWVGWDFRKTGTSKIPHQFQHMIDTGIWNRLEVEIEIKRYNRERKPVDPDKEFKSFETDISQTMDSGLMTLYILCAGVVTAASISISVECRHFILLFLQFLRHFVVRKAKKAWFYIVTEGIQEKFSLKCA